MIALVAAMLFATVGLLKLASSQLKAFDASPESEEAQGEMNHLARSDRKRRLKSADLRVGVCLRCCDV